MARMTDVGRRRHLRTEHGVPAFGSQDDAALRRHEALHSEGSIKVPHHHDSPGEMTG